MPADPRAGREPAGLSAGRSVRLEDGVQVFGFENLGCEYAADQRDGSQGIVISPHATVSPRGGPERAFHAARAFVFKASRCGRGSRVLDRPPLFECL